MDDLAKLYGSNVMSRLMQSGFNINCLRTNATLREDEWKQLDRIVIQVARQRLRAVNDLMSRGLTTRVNGLATSVLQWQTQSRTGEVNTSMDPQIEGNSEALNFELKQLPLPIFHADYQIGMRQLTTSRQNGWQGLDVLMASQKALDIATKVENTLINGASFSYAGADLFGYTTFPQRVTIDLQDWLTASGEDIVDDVLAMVQAQFNQFSFGPYILYIPLVLATKISEDYSSTKGTNTIEDRILAIKQISSIEVLDLLADDAVLLIQMTQDKVEMVEGLPISNVQWDEKGGMTSHYKIMTIMVPRLFADQDGNSGIVHGTLGAAS